MPTVEQQQRELHVHGEQAIMAPSAHVSESSPYRHDGWYGDPDAGSQLSVAEIETRGTRKTLWIAKTVLRRETTVSVHTVLNTMTGRRHSQIQANTSHVR